MSLLVQTPRPLPVRLLDYALTGIGWLAFSYLITAGVIAVVNGVDHSLEFPFMGGVVATPTALLLYVTVCAINALLLMLWGTYRKRVTRIPPTGLRMADDIQLAERFALSTPQLQDIRLSRMVVIHHAEDGEISRWEGADDTSIRLSA